MKKILGNRRTRLIIALVFWLVFAGVLYLMIYQEQRKLDEATADYNRRHNFSVDFDYMKSSLLNNDYDYLFIVIDDDIISYKGQYINKQYTGTVSKNNTKNQYTNIKVLDKKYPYLSLDKMFSLFGNEFPGDSNTFIYENDNIYVKIRVSIDNIINIELDDKKVIYQLEISNIQGFDVKGSE